MDKVRFGCPRCQTIMQTGAEKVGYDVACPHCAHRFKLVESSDQSIVERVPSGSSADPETLPPSTSPVGGGTAPSLGYVSNVPERQVYGTAGSAPVYSQLPLSSPQAGFTCPYCQTKRPPVWKSEVSQVGWIVFAVLLVTTCVFCVIGLFIRDKYRVCSQCKIRLD